MVTCAFPVFRPPASSLLDRRSAAFVRLWIWERVRLLPIPPALLQCYSLLGTGEALNATRFRFHENLMLSMKRSGGPPTARPLFLLPRFSRQRARSSSRHIA